MQPNKAPPARRHLRTIAAACSLVGPFAASTLAAPITWLPTGGGDFNTGANWSSGTVPTVADDAIFGDNASGVIATSAAANPLRLSFRKSAGTLSVNASGGTLSLGNTTTGGQVILGTAAGQVNDITLSGGTFAATHTTAGALIQVGNFAGSNGNRLTITGAGTHFTSPSTSGAIAAVGIAGSNDNTLSVLSGANVVLRGSMAIGVIGANPSSGNLLEVNSATFSLTGGSRGINLRNGTLSLTGGYSDLGFLLANDAGNNTTISFNSGELYSRRTQVDNGKNFVIGDGGSTPAVYGVAYSTGTMTIGSVATPADLVLASNGILTGGGAGTITVAAGGRLRGDAGAKVMPSIIGQPVLTTDDRATGTINFTGLWDNTNLELVLDVGDFPSAAANVPPFTPLDFINVNGTFVHGGTVTFDVSGYVEPPGPAEFRVVGWTGESGSAASTSVQFVGGPALAFRFDTDGLYLTVPEPGAVAAVASIGMMAALRRRRRQARRSTP